MYIPSALKLANIIVAFSKSINKEVFITEDVFVSHYYVEVVFDHKLTEAQYNTLEQLLPNEFEIRITSKTIVKYYYQ